MRYRLFLLAGAVLPLLASRVAAPPQTRNVSMIDGTWVPAAATMGGQPFPAALLTSMQLVVKDGQYVVTVAGQIDRGTVTIDTSTTPMAMTVSGVEGPNEGKTYPAIFAVVGETLRICYDLSGRQRPTAFASPPGSMHFLVDYRRIAQ